MERPISGLAAFLAVMTHDVHQMLGEAGQWRAFRRDASVDDRAGPYGIGAE